MRLLAGPPTATSLSQALEDIESAGEGANDGQNRVPDGGVALLVMRHAHSGRSSGRSDGIGRRGRMGSGGRGVYLAHVC